MKNLLIFINPEKRFVNKNLKGETGILAKIQIDNSLDLGWKRENILLVTNFDYEYNGVKALVVDDSNYCAFSVTASKINVILTLFEQGIIKKDLYWFHDLDAFQLEKITEDELELGDMDMGITEYGKTTIKPLHDKRLSTGSIFFKQSAQDIFEWIKIKVYQYKCNEEVGLLELTKIPKYKLSERMKRLDITYNLATRKRQVSVNYQAAKKPLKVIHFHPFDKRSVRSEGKNDNIAVCIYGKNKINKVLVTKRLVKIFNYHGIC